MKCDSGITPLNKTAAYDVEVHHHYPINVKYADNEPEHKELSLNRWSNCQ